MRRVLAVFQIISLLALTQAVAQTFTVSGVVRDSSTNEALQFAKVVISGTTKGTVTSANGSYRFELASGNYELMVSSVGYKSMKMRFAVEDHDVELNVSLLPTEYLLQEVTIYSAGEATGEKNVSSTSLQSQQVSEISGIFRDVFRVLQALPGVSVDNEMSAKFNVRGGNYDENLVLVNDMQVYDPFHIKEAPHASVGIFNVDLMKRVDMITGGFSARYGDKMSSVLNIKYREGNRERIRGSGSLSITDLNLVLEGPLSADGSFIVGVRKSYFEYLMDWLDIKEGIHPSFYDVQGTVNYNLTTKNKLLFQFIHSGDDFRLDPSLSSSIWKYNTDYMGEQGSSTLTEDRYEEAKARYLTSLFSLSSVNVLGTSGFLKTGVSYYDEIEDEYGIDTLAQNERTKTATKDYFRLYIKDKVQSNDLRITTAEAKTSLTYQVTPLHELEMGISYQSIGYRQDVSNSDIRMIINNTDFYPDTNVIVFESDSADIPNGQVDTKSFKLAGYLQDVWQVNDEIIVNIGGRIDYFGFNKDLTLSPRLSLSYIAPFGTIFRAAWGFYYQSPIYKQFKYSYSSSDNTRAQRSVHYILGLEHNFSESFSLKVEGYYKRYTDLISSERSSYWYLTYSKENDAVGFAVGMDVYAMVKSEDFYGWLSYGLLSAQEDKLTDDIGYYPRYTDQRHTVSLVADIDLGRQWLLGFRIFYGSGYAYTPKTARLNSSEDRWEWVTGEKNSAYYPDYRRVDARLSKEFTLGNFSLLAFLDVINLFSFDNVLAYRYRFDGNGMPTIEEIKLFPIIPTAGMTFRF